MATPTVADGLNSLQGKMRPTAHAVIVGGGPSAKNWQDRLPKDWAVGGAYVIAINGAFQLVNPAPSCVLYLDYDEPRSSWVDELYQVKCADKIFPNALREEYPDAIHCKVSTDEPELRSARLGLKMCPAETGTRLVGTSALCALHLAGILGASKVSMVGVDLCFAGDKGEVHHPYPCRNYGEHPTTSGDEMTPKYERIFPVNGKKIPAATQGPDGFYYVWSCDWFVASAKRIREYMNFAGEHGMECQDYSGGLLSVV